MGQNIGEKMEAAEEAATVAMARVCREPSDYALFRIAGHDAVTAARTLTQTQRVMFIVRLAQVIEQIRDEARVGERSPRQEALWPKGRLREEESRDRPGQQRVRPDLGFDDET